MNAEEWLTDILMNDEIDNKSTISFAAACVAMAAPDGVIHSTYAELMETARIGSSATLKRAKDTLENAGYLMSSGRSSFRLTENDNSSLSEVDSSMSEENTSVSAVNASLREERESRQQKENLSPTPPMKRKTSSVSSTDSTDSGRAGGPAREDSDDRIAFANERRRVLDVADNLDIDVDAEASNLELKRAVVKAERPDSERVDSAGEEYIDAIFDEIKEAADREDTTDPFERASRENRKSREDSKQDNEFLSDPDSAFLNSMK